MKLRVMTFNVRYSRGRDGINVWSARKNLVADLVARHQPDIIGFQEPLQGQMDDLREMLSGYNDVGVAREDGRRDGEYNPVFFKQSFSVGQSGTFWLSDTPDSPSRTWEGQTRICTWARFGGPAELVFFNTHFEYCSVDTQVKSARLVVERATEPGGNLPLILTGDFNLCPRSTAYDILGEAFADSFLAAPRKPGDHRLISAHGFTGRTKNSRVPWRRKSCRIDYIWLRGNVSASRCDILFDHPGAGIYPSDHWPVVADVEL